MRNLSTPFKFDIDNLVAKARQHVRKRVDGITINLPFISFSVHPDDIEKKVAREIVIRLADKRVLNAFECCDDCIDKALASLQEIRSLLVDKQVDLANHTDSTLYLIIELMLEGIRQFFTFEEKFDTKNNSLPIGIHKRFRICDRDSYFSGLEMLRGHLYRCLNQIALLADMKIPKIAEHMRYEDTWQLCAYKKPQITNKKIKGDR